MFAPETEEKEQSGIVDVLYEGAKTLADLADRRSRAVIAGRVIADLVRGRKDQPSPASLSILPEAFLAGVYLAAADLV